MLLAGCMPSPKTDFLILFNEFVNRNNKSKNSLTWLKKEQITIKVT